MNDGYQWACGHISLFPAVIGRYVFYGFDAAIDNLNEKRSYIKQRKKRIAGRCGFLRWSAVRGSISIRYS